MEARPGYTVEVYKADKRLKKGERLLHKTDYNVDNEADLRKTMEMVWGSKKGHRYEIHKTYVIKRSVDIGYGSNEFEERYDTPYYCSPSSETYWSM